ncbi:PAS domain S-box protein [Trichocoleus sp. Lan]|uniref:PAS domain S-box protein n=1 Tax=Trichocoleus sp. Lan TaxID=2933927 RepID=UPI0032988A13
MGAEKLREMAEKLLVGGGELGALLRSHDWSPTPLGAVETWSDDLKTAVQILLTELDQTKSPGETQPDAQKRQDNAAVLQAVNQLNAFRVKLAEALRPLTDASEIQASAARILGESLGASRVIYIEVVSDGEEVIVHCNYTSGVAQLSGRYRLEDYRRNLSADHQAGHTQVVTDIPHDPKYTDAQKKRYREIDIAAHIDVPLIKNNQFVAVLAVQQSTPRRWTETEVKLVEETAEQTWAAAERALAQAALRESEAKYRTLFESIDQGFCVIEVLFDENSQPFDYRFLETNPAFEKQTGLLDAQGKRVRELAPNHEEHWFEIYGNIAASGKPKRFENRAADLNRWYDIYAFRIGHPDEKKVAILFNDISDRKRVEDERKQAETALQQSEAQSKNILESITDGFFALDQNWRFTYVNPQAERILDRTLGDLLGKVIWEEYPGIVGTEFERAYYQAVSERVASSLTSFYPDHNCWYEAHVYPATDGITVYFRNVTEQVQASAALRESEEKTRNILESIAEAFFALDQDWRFTYMNRAAEVLLDRTPGDLLGKSLWEEYPGLADNELAPVYRRAMDDRVPGVLTAFYPDHDRWYDVRTYPAADGIAVYFNNVTAQIQAATALRESEERFRSMADNAPVMVWVTDSTGYCTYLSRSWYEFTGQTEETGLGFGWLNAVHPEDFEDSKAIFLTANERYEAFQLEYRLRSKDGEYRWAIDAASPWFGVDGQFKGFIGSVIDISSRKQSEEALRESENRLRLALESAELGTWDFNPISGVLRWDDPCKAAFGLPPESEINYDVFLSGLHPDDRERTNQVVQFALNPESNGEFDIEYRTIGLKDGVERWIAAKGKAFFNPAGIAIRFIGTVLNITEKKRIEAEREHLLQREQAAREMAEQANQIKDEFLAVLSHELRSPLNPILGWSKLLQNRKLDPAKTQIALKTIERNAQLQADLIEDLLDVSRILQGKLNLDVSPLNLVSIIQAASETVRLAAEAKSIQVSASLEPNVGLVRGDSTRLQQVIWNLLSNAVKFTPQGGQVNIRLERLDSHAQITVSDTGQGIESDFLPYVFDYFRQSDATITRKFGGLGLGLAIVRNLVELHGGTIRAESPGTGMGATFTVKLPLIPIIMIANQNSQSSEPASDLNGIQVLVVDDDTDSREFVAFVLEEAGAKVMTAATATEALTMLMRSKPNVLLSDIGMPDIDGYTLMQQVRALPTEQGGQVLAIALTAYAGDFNQQQALRAGFQQHLSKPIEPESLVRAISRLLNHT